MNRIIQVFLQFTKIVQVKKLKRLFRQGTAKQKQASKTYHAYKLRYNRVNRFIAKDITVQGCLRKKNRNIQKFVYIKQDMSEIKLPCF